MQNTDIKYRKFCLLHQKQLWRGTCFAIFMKAENWGRVLMETSNTLAVAPSALRLMNVCHMMNLDKEFVRY